MKYELAGIPVTSCTQEQADSINKKIDALRIGWGNYGDGLLADIIKNRS